MQESDSCAGLPDSFRRPDPAARNAGRFLVLTACITVISLIGRILANADQPALLESLNAIASNRFLYGSGGGARMISGITLVVAAWFLMKTWIIQKRIGSSLVPVIFMASGIFTAISGVCAVAMAVAVPVGLDSSDVVWETTAAIREISGKAGFSAAGLSILVLAMYQWRVGGKLRYIAPISVLLGVVMQLIWIEFATQVHQFSGALFLLWLLVIGALLLTGRVEQYYIALPNFRLLSSLSGWCLSNAAVDIFHAAAL